eukprot:TRINITY_DN4063_c0_g1_i5.p1 TRINITY_DN4063_c0_g1~~TRINITY_DN4063_c0_g1_i5.p1  ORF type:complete len:304 (+),score=83.89 TRINITY_DN4063_c0_g1_i5:97-912(+)
MAPQSPAPASPGSSRAAPSAIIGGLVDAVAAANGGAQSVNSRDIRSVFECTQAPSLSFSEYMKRFRRFRQVDSLWVQAIVIAHRLQTKADTPINSHTVHRLMLTCFLCAAKLNIDNSEANKIVAGHGGVQTSELSFMETCLLIILDWTVLVSGEEWSLIMDNLDLLEAHAAAVRGSGGPATLLPEALARALDNLRGLPCAEGATVVHVPAPPSTTRTAGTFGGRCHERAQPRTEEPENDQLKSSASSAARRGNRLDAAMHFGRQVETQPAH